MPDVVLVNHPAAVRYVPMGGRNERLGLMSLTTPVSLREVDPSGFEPIGRILEGADRGFVRGAAVRDRALYARDGSVWMGLEGLRGSPLGRDDLVRFLGSGAAPDDEGDLAMHFSRTAVLAMSGSHRRQRSCIEPDRMRSMVSDGSARARADLRRHVGEDVAIVGDEVRVRLRSIVCGLVTPRWEDRGDPSRVRPSVFPRSRENLPWAWRLDQPAEFVAFRNRNRPGSVRPEGTVLLPGDEGVEAYLGLVGSGPFPFHLTRGGEVTIFVNEAHGHLLDLTVVKEMAKLDGLTDAARRALARSQAWEMLGSMSAIRPSEYGECLADLKTLVEEARAAHRRAANSPSIDRLVRALDEAVLPAWRECNDAVPVGVDINEDELALGGLVP